MTYLFSNWSVYLLTTVTHLAHPDPLPLLSTRLFSVFMYLGFLLHFVLKLHV